MIGLGIGGVLNIFLDPIFIFGLDLGISGAAIATLLSQCVSASILASFFLRGRARSGSQSGVSPPRQRPISRFSKAECPPSSVKGWPVCPPWR